MLNFLVYIKCTRVIAIQLYKIYSLDSQWFSFFAWAWLAIHLHGVLGQQRDAATLLQQTMTLYPKQFRLFGRVAQGVLNREPILSAILVCSSAFTVIM